jgi:hypothetical protein
VIGGRAGAVLVTVVLITLAMFTIGHGLLVLSLAELSASRAGARHLEARSAAESAVVRSLSAHDVAWMDSVPPGAGRVLGTWSLGRASAVAEARRLSSEAWWLEGTGTVGAGTSRTARLAWALDPLERVLALDGVLTVGAMSPVLVEGTVDPAGSAVDDAPAGAPTCDPWIGALDARYAIDPLQAVATLAPGDTLPALGMLGFAEILRSAEVFVTGTGSPQPLDALGVCAESEPWNWGDPDRPWRPCGSQWVFRAAAGDLRMEGGVGQGLLVVDGGLTLTAGARFYGIALVRGTLRVEDGGRFQGMAVAVGGAYVAGGAIVRGSACRAVRALDARRRELSGLRLVPGVGSLGTH